MVFIASLTLVGTITTPILGDLPSEGKNSLGALSKAVGLERLGEPSEIAQVVTFLASSRASYINGVGIAVNGGMIC
jgi:NAD(P)-dependent dehydrogenase (short-subunit alcohol dehydrogenase family)